MFHTAATAAVPSPMPGHYIPHGAGPCFFMDWQPADEWYALKDYLASVQQRLPRVPKAIVVISAHWLEAEFTVLTQAQPQLLFDYYGFPESTYQLSYPAANDLPLTETIVQRIQGAGLRVNTDAERNYDHGVFIPLLLMFPEAQIPVVQISLRQDLDPAAHIQLGQALASLAEEDVFILGSGMSFHNMRGYGDPQYTAASQQFDQWLTDTLCLPVAERNAALANWQQAPAARLCHPVGAEEHLLPLMVVAGASRQPAQKAFSQLQLKIQISAFEFG